MPTAKPYRLSPSSLNLFLDCARCFWLDKIKYIKRPRGIFPSLPGGMDAVIKVHFDEFRKQGKLPDELRELEDEGISLYTNQRNLDRWRSWRTGLACRPLQGENVELSGALDDLLVKKEQFIPFDYKTKGSPVTREDAVKYYQNQLDCYALMLDYNGMPAAGFAYLLYYSPAKVSENGNVTFHLQPIKVMVDVIRAKETVQSALKTLQEEIPAPAPRCEYCGWLKKFYD